MNNLYTPDGWLNFEYILSRGAWLNIIIGKRQVGKTYGTLQLMLKHDLTHVLLRRTTEEVDTISATPDLCPYKVFEPDYKVSFFKSGSKICRISDYIIGSDEKAKEERQRGIITSLAQISHIRGFNGSVYSDLVFDEFIPEKGVICRKTDGDAFLNAYVTINGNRELNGAPPLRAWLLANTNNINSPILEALNVTDDILSMRRKGKEELFTDNGVLIIQPQSVDITAKRKDTALMRQIDTKSDFYGMAIDNRFAYDESPYIKTMPIKNLTPLWAYDNTMYCWETPTGFYLCRAKFKTDAQYRYDGTRTGRERLYTDFGYMKPFYYYGAIAFADMRLYTLFKTIFEID